MSDAIRVRDVLARNPRPARVIILGAGLIAAETSALLREAGHDIVLVARSAAPGRAALGSIVAEQLADLHRTHVATHFGRTPQALTVEDDEMRVRLGDGTLLCADLVVAALGTIPDAPRPWTGGLDVDDRMRADGAPLVYAAGGVATHRHDDLGSWRIDHWADAAAQGAHAARAVLYDLGLAADAGPYAPRSSYAVRTYGQTLLVGAGYAGPDTIQRIVSTEPLLVVHERDRAAVGVVGFNASRLVQDWTDRLFGATHGA